MAQYSDKQYYAFAEDRIFEWRDLQPLGASWEFHDIVYLATDPNTYYTLVGVNNAAGQMPGASNIWETITRPVIGDNRFLSLEDIVNNYIVLYGDVDLNHGGAAMRRKVEAFAQRSIQEFSYDTFRVKTWEYELFDIARIPLPQDYVELVGINWVNQFGVEQWLVPRKDSGNPRSPLQDMVSSTAATETYSPHVSYEAGDLVLFGDGEDETTYVAIRDITANAGDPDDSSNWMRAATQTFSTGSTYDVNELVVLDGSLFMALQMIPAGTNPRIDNRWLLIGEDGQYLYDSEGNLTLAEGSATKDRFDENSDQRGTTSLSTHSTSTGGYYTYGKRYYLDTESVSRAPTYVINDESGFIDIDPIVLNVPNSTDLLENGDKSYITLRYISDGLSNDLSEIKVHKFTEQALYDAIYYNMIVMRSDVPMNEKQRAQRKAYASKRTAKLRLMDFTPREIKQTLRAQAMWIKT